MLFSILIENIDSCMSNLETNYEQLGKYLFLLNILVSVDDGSKNKGLI